MLIKKLNIALIGVGICFGNQVKGQITRSQIAGQQNVITTAVPFLTISPDSRRAAMGDAGVASSGDANSIFWNPAALTFAEKKAGVSFSYAPWLASLVSGISLNYLAGYSKIGDRSIAGVSMRYFDYGQINFTDDMGNPLGTGKPNEFSVDGSYATKLTDNWAIGASLRYIRSNLAGTVPINGITPKPGVTGAGDIFAYFQKDLKKDDKISYSFGAMIQNIGAKISYTDKNNQDFIPTTLKLGTAWTYELDEYNKLTVMFDINKLMVPTPQRENIKNHQGGDSISPDGQVLYQIVRSDDPVISAALKSFGDAPGGLKEELKEYNLCLGLEYWYSNQFAVRAGVFNEAETKGNRKYATVGFGLRYKTIGIDAAYLIPFIQRHPLQNQLRFSLLFNFGDTE